MTGQYPEVFHEEFGNMKGEMAYIQVLEGAIPRYFKSGPVVREIKRLEAAGIIVSMTYPEWVAPIVAIIKTDGSIQICRDYKVTVNQAG